MVSPGLISVIEALVVTQRETTGTQREPHPPFFSALVLQIPSALNNHHHEYRYRIYTFDQHPGHTMDHKAYPYSINAGNTDHTIANSHRIIVNTNKAIADENLEIMEWLSPLDPGGRHQDVRTNRVDGVGDWVLETNEFREWRSEGGAGGAVLFCHGDPGVGKTYLR